MPIDLTLTPLYRINGQDQASLPGLVAQMPPQNAARGREKDRLAVYLLLTGTASFSTSEYLKIAQDAAAVFYKTSGALTSALRGAADQVNKTLLERNTASTAKGQYAVGWLTLAALRDTQCTLALSGPMHVFWFGRGESRHVHEPAVSGRGLGYNQTINVYYTQAALNPGDRMLLYGKAPSAWDTTLNDPSAISAPTEVLERRLQTLTGADLNAVMVQAVEGAGTLTLLKGAGDTRSEPAPAPVEAPAPAVETPAPAVPSAPTPSADPLSRLPRNPNAGVQPVQKAAETPAAGDEPEQEVSTPRPARRKREREPLLTPDQTRQAARSAAGWIQFMRRTSGAFGERVRQFLPRLLPESDPAAVPGNPTTGFMMFMAVAIPLVVVTIASVFYLRYGRSQQYETYFSAAQSFKTQAQSLPDQVEQRQAWENVRDNVDKALSYRDTSEARALQLEAGAGLDALLGIKRLKFNPAFSARLDVDISRMAAGESDLYMLNAVNGEVLHAVLAQTGGGYEVDSSFDCKPGAYGNVTVGPLVDIAVLPLVNIMDATLLGIDAGGNLLYCAPGQPPQVATLAAPTTGWGRVTGFWMDGISLYVLDPSKRAVWIYPGKNGDFPDPPYFFFGNQTPEKQDVIDIIVSDRDLYMLHANGQLSTCTYSLIDGADTHCVDPVPFRNPFLAYGSSDLFASAHFTQVLFTALPGQSILLLDSDSTSQGVFRFAPRTLDLQEQYRPAGGVFSVVDTGPISAMAVGANHYLYLAVNGQVYFSSEMP